MEFWYELASETELSSLTRDVEVRAEEGPLVLTLRSSDVPAQHLNKSRPGLFCGKAEKLLTLPELHLPLAFFGWSLSSSSEPRGTLPVR